MARSQFLLMSATLGATTLFEQELTRLTGVPTVVVASAVRPVPLEFSYVEDEALGATVEALVISKKAPVYVVHFTQNEAAETAQELMCVNYCTPSEKAALAEALVGVKFSSPYGKEIKKLLRHGIGLHHAGLLPKYRVLVERLAQRGLLKIICGTDTLGVGVNVPIRTVLLTRLTKFSGTKTGTLTARDFHQITGRAGRKGFDDIGYVVGMAPEHVIENARQEAKAAGDPKKMKKLVKRKPPEKFVSWSSETFQKLRAAPPEPLVSRFQVTHGMLLQVLGRAGDGCAAMRQLLRDCHEPAGARAKHRKRAWQLFRSLHERGIIEILPPRSASKLKVNGDLQQDFSLNHTLALYLIDTLALLDQGSATYPLDVLTLIESILENPDIVLRRQLDALKTESINAWKQEGMEYEERMAKLEELEYPKPQRDFIYNTFNAFATAHPWVGTENIRPKSIVREMVENFVDFHGYIHLYDLERTEGVLLRHLASVYKVLAQTVPPQFKNEDVQEIENWLAGLVRGIDSSLLDEWEKLRDPNWKPTEVPADAAPEFVDITRNKRELTALIRQEIFHFLRSLSAGKFADAAALVPPWSAEEISSRMTEYFLNHARLMLDPEARNSRHTYVSPTGDDANLWRAQQVLVDDEGANDWQATFQVSLAKAREDGRVTLELLGVESIVEGSKIS